MILRLRFVLEGIKLHTTLAGGWLVQVYCRLAAANAAADTTTQPFRRWPIAMGALFLYDSCWLAVCDTLVSHSLSMGLS